LGDIIVIGKSLYDHIKNLRTVFQRLREANLNLNIEKCEFFKDELKYLGTSQAEEAFKQTQTKFQPFEI
jgi:hypothetical protein